MTEEIKTKERSDSVRIFTSFHNYYELLDTRASGSFATVKVGRYSITGENVAIKIVNKTRLDSIAISHLSSEISCLRLIQHPNVVKLYDLYESSSKLYFVMELGDGDLYQHIMNHYKDLGMPEDSVRYFFRQIVSALNYCHKIRIVHRDLKPQNIIIFKSTNVIKLGDFGFSSICEPGHYLHTTCGSLPYTAPEIFLDESYDPRKSDIWSLAVILFIMLTGQIPFDHVNQSEMLTMVIDCKYHLPSFVSQEARDLVARMLVRNPNDRLPLAGIFISSFYKDDCENLKALEGKTLLISRILHQYVISEIVKHQIATRSEVINSLVCRKCNFISAAYHLIANDAFKRAINQDTVNYTLIVDNDILDEEMNTENDDTIQKDENHISTSRINKLSTEYILHEISASMEDVSLQSSSIHKSHSLRQPREKMAPYKNYNKNTLSTMNGISTNPDDPNYNNNNNNNNMFGMSSSVRNVSSKVFKRESLSKYSKSKFNRNNTPGLHSLSELTLNESHNEAFKINSATCLNVDNKEKLVPKYAIPTLNKDTSSGTDTSLRSSQNKPNPDIIIPSIDINTNNNSIITWDNETICRDRPALSVGTDSPKRGSGSKNSLSLLCSENVVCRTKSLNTKTKKRFFEFFSSKK